MEAENRTPSKAGLTLVELMIAMGVLSMLAIGLMTGTFQTRKITEENIYHSAALNATIGYLEQIKSLPYADLKMSASSSVPLETKIDSNTDDPLILNIWNKKTLTINTDEDGNPIETMTFYVLPQVQDLSVEVTTVNWPDFVAVPASETMPAMAINMRYAWTSPATNQYRFGNERIVRSSVVTY